MYKIYAMLRDSRGLSDYQVAEELGIARSTLSNWKSGKYNPKADKLKKIADFFNVPLEYLVNGNETLFDIAVKKTRQDKFVSLFNSLSPKDQDRIMLIMESFLNSDEYKEKEMQTS